MRILAFGGRNYWKPRQIFDALNTLNARHSGGISLLIVGGAPGADKLAQDWAIEHRVPHLVVPAKWEELGDKAGPIRNAAMLKWKPQGAVGFPGGDGTADMAKRCEEAGVKVWWPDGKAMERKPAKEET